MPLLEINNLVKTWQGSEPVLEIDSFTCDHRSLVALKGSSGCGKTTFLNLLAGILSADRGEIKLDGKD